MYNSEIFVKSSSVIFLISLFISLLIACATLISLKYKAFFWLEIFTENEIVSPTSDILLISIPA